MAAFLVDAGGTPGIVHGPGDLLPVFLEKRFYITLIPEKKR
jgi:hypothetical protein